MPPTENLTELAARLELEAENCARRAMGFPAEHDGARYWAECCSDLRAAARVVRAIQEVKDALAPLVPPIFHKSVPLSWVIYTAFASGGSLHSYTVDQAKRAQEAIEAQP